MMSLPELSLPEKSPPPELEDQPDLAPVALYALIDLTYQQLEELRAKCEIGCIETGGKRGEAVCLSPRPRFVGESLRAIFDYHLELRNRQQYDPVYFIAVTSPDWQAKGVVLVTLDNDSLKRNVDSIWIKAEDSGLAVANLQIANSSWGEYKEDHRTQNHDREENEDTADDRTDFASDEGPVAPATKPPIGYNAGVYIHSSLSEIDVVACIEPSFKTKKPENICCQIQAKLDPEKSSSHDLVNRAAFLHPWRCRKNKWLHKTYFLLVDTSEPSEYGMLVVKLPNWCEGSKITDSNSLHRISEELLSADIPYIRIPYSCVHGFQGRFTNFANGVTTWPSDQARSRPFFAVFEYNNGRYFDSKAMSLLDPERRRRSPEDECIGFATNVVFWNDNSSDIVNWNFDEALRRFPQVCRAWRLTEGMNMKYFICIDYSDGDVEDRGVLIVRRDWDEDVSRRDRNEYLELDVVGVKILRVPAGEALDILEKGIKGSTQGMSNELIAFFASGPN